MKDDVRVLAVDDGPFSFGDAASFLVGLVVRGKGYLEAVHTTTVSVDHLDATQAMVGLVDRCKQRPQLKAVMLDGLTVAGFNVVDIGLLHKFTGLPVITVVDKVPDHDSIEAALRKRFRDWEERLRLISAPETHEVVLEDGAVLTCHLAGMYVSEARELLRVTTLRGHLPEPLRMADLVASGLPRLKELRTRAPGDR